MSKYRYCLLFMVAFFAGTFAYFVGSHLSFLERIEYQLTMNTLALDHCSNALSALVASRVYPIKCTLAETYWNGIPQYTNTFIHSVRFEKVQK